MTWKETNNNREANISYDHNRYTFCNYFSLGVTRNCHDLQHKKYHGKTIDTEQQ